MISVIFTSSGWQRCGAPREVEVLVAPPRCPFKMDTATRLFLQKETLHPLSMLSSSMGSGCSLRPFSPFTIAAMKPRRRSAVAPSAPSRIVCIVIESAAKKPGSKKSCAWW